MELSNKEAINYKGGFKMSLSLASFLIGGVTFILGIVNGYFNTKCSK